LFSVKKGYSFVDLARLIRFQLAGYFSDGRLKIIAILQIRNSDCKMLGAGGISNWDNINDFKLIN
jgi:hypothetical protein